MENCISFSFFCSVVSALLPVLVTLSFYYLKGVFKKEGYKVWSRTAPYVSGMVKLILFWNIESVLNFFQRVFGHSVCYGVVGGSNLFACLLLFVISSVVIWVAVYKPIKTADLLSK